MFMKGPKMRPLKPRSTMPRLSKPIEVASAWKYLAVDHFKQRDAIGYLPPTTSTFSNIHVHQIR